MTFPPSARGKTALVEGVVSVSTLSAEEQIKQDEHHAQEQGTTFDPKSVKGPKTLQLLFEAETCSVDLPTGAAAPLFFAIGIAIPVVRRLLLTAGDALRAGPFHRM